MTPKNAVDAVCAEGGVVSDTVVFLDREEGGKHLFEQDGIKMHSLLKISEVANTLFETGAIDQESKKTILKQTKKQ